MARLQGKNRCVVREQDVLAAGESAKFSLSVSLMLDFLAEKQASFILQQIFQANDINPYLRLPWGIKIT